MSNTVNKRAEGYYDDAQILYNLFWSDKALHYGFWNKDTKRLSDAIKNTDVFVSELLNLQKNDRVLDVGCGVGGTSLFIAEKFGAEVVGINLSRTQLKQAREKAKGLKLENLVSFEIMDFNKTKFRDGTFTKIFGIESVCHANNKLHFLKETYRLLKPGGRIVVADGFLKKRKLTQEEEDIYNKCLRGWKVLNLSHKAEFLKDLREAGFKKIKFYDKTDEIIPSSRRMALLGYLGFPFAFILSRLDIIRKNLYENYVAMINQQKTFNNFTLYGVFVAEKGNRKKDK
ncbi:MAG: methyltransferase domain-containing protein [Candidatus Micrarchaeota archaeon]